MFLKAYIKFLNFTKFRSTNIFKLLQQKNVILKNFIH